MPLYPCVPFSHAPDTSSPNEPSDRRRPGGRAGSPPPLMKRTNYHVDFKDNEFSSILVVRSRPYLVETRGHSGPRARSTDASSKVLLVWRMLVIDSSTAGARRERRDETAGELEEEGRAGEAYDRRGKRFETHGRGRGPSEGPPTTNHQPLLIGLATPC